MLLFLIIFGCKTVDRNTISMRAGDLLSKNVHKINDSKPYKTDFCPSIFDGLIVRLVFNIHWKILVAYHDKNMGICYEYVKMFTKRQSKYDMSSQFRAHQSLLLQ